jgi:hypothetical protein
MARLLSTRPHEAGGLYIERLCERTVCHQQMNPHLLKNGSLTAWSVTSFFSSPHYLVADSLDNPFIWRSIR